MQRELVTHIVKGQCTFFGIVMRREQLKYIMTMGELSEEGAKGKPRRKGG